MAAQLVAKLPEGPDWLYELKFDGYRALLLRDGADVRIVSRNRRDLSCENFHFRRRVCRSLLSCFSVSGFIGFSAPLSTASFTLRMRHRRLMSVMFAAKK